MAILVGGVRYEAIGGRATARIGDRDVTRYVVNVFNSIRDCACRTLEPVHRAL